MVAKVTIIHRAKFFHILGWLKESLSHVGSENLSRRPFLLPKSALAGSPFSEDTILAGARSNPEGERRRVGTCLLIRWMNMSEARRGPQTIIHYGTTLLFCRAGDPATRSWSS